MRFEHENGPGTIVQIGSRAFDLAEDFDDPGDIALLADFPGVREVRKQKGPVKLPPAAPALEPEPEPKEVKE